MYVLCFFNRTRQICLLPPVPSPPICFPQESQMIFWNHHSKHVPTCLKNLLEPHPSWELGLCGSISFPGLRQQITTNWMACNTNSLSHSSGKRSPNSRCQRSRAPSEGSSRGSFLASSGPGGSRCSSVPGSFALFSAVSIHPLLFALSLPVTRASAFEAHTDNPER